MIDLMKAKYLERVKVHLQEKRAHFSMRQDEFRSTHIEPAVCPYKVVTRRGHTHEKKDGSFDFGYTIQDLSADMGFRLSSLRRLIYQKNIPAPNPKTKIYTGDQAKAISEYIVHRYKRTKTIDGFFEFCKERGIVYDKK